MFERRPLLSFLTWMAICLTFLLILCQISLWNVVVYRESSVATYLPLVSASSAEPNDQQYGGDSNALGIGSGEDGNDVTLRNITSSVLHDVASANRRWWIKKYRRDRGRPETASRQAPTGSSSNSSSTQSTASLTLTSSGPSSLRNDYTSLIDLTDFMFTINRDYCGPGGVRPGGRRRKRNRSGPADGSLKRADALRGSRSPTTVSPPLVLILIHSAPANVAKRNTIRETWGAPDSRALLIFLMGAVNSTESQHAIEEESRVHDDIVQGSFVDAYRNMTYKHVMALKWFTYHCPGAQYVLKTDDDVFINTPDLYDVLGQVMPQRDMLLCQLVTKLSVKRTHRSKWFVSWQEYPAPYYPPHCPGYSILYSPDVAVRLYHEAQRQPFFWIDDVHITGTVAQQVNVTITPMGELYLDTDDKRDLLQGRLNASERIFFFTNPNLSGDQIRQLWDVVRPL